MPRVLYLLMLALCLGALPATAHEPLLPEDQAQQLGAFFEAVESTPLETLARALGADLDDWNSRLALIPTGELMHLMHAKQARGLPADRQQAVHRLLAGVRAFRIVEPLGDYASDMAAAMITDPAKLMPLLCWEEPRRPLFEVMTALLAEKNAELRWAVLDAALRIYTFEVPRDAAGQAASCRALIERGLRDEDFYVRARTTVSLLYVEPDWAAWPSLQNAPLWRDLEAWSIPGPLGDWTLRDWRTYAARHFIRRLSTSRRTELFGEESPSFAWGQWRQLLRRALPSTANPWLDAVWTVPASHSFEWHPISTSRGDLKIRVYGLLDRRHKDEAWIDAHSSNFFSGRDVTRFLREVGDYILPISAWGVYATTVVDRGERWMSTRRGFRGHAANAAGYWSRTSPLPLSDVELVWVLPGRTLRDPLQVRLRLMTKEPPVRDRREGNGVVVVPREPKRPAGADGK